MSFSSDVKKELEEVSLGEMHCRKAELSALLRCYARIDEGEPLSVSFPSDNIFAQRKCFTLLDKTFNIGAYILEEEVGEDVILTSENSDIYWLLKELDIFNPLPLLKKDCCKRAYLRGAFIASGFISDPSKGYHFELTSNSSELSKLLTDLIAQFNISPKCSKRKRADIIYVKEAESVFNLLSILGAHKSLMDMANARIVREVRNSVNRRNNCDTANIAKAVSAASKQIEDILLIDETVGLDSLSDSLKEMAKVRLANPESSITELGLLLEGKVGKSGVNHRLRRLSEIAEGIRVEREEDEKAGHHNKA